MLFDTPAETNPIDQLKIIGHATDRIDGPLKTTGTATYAYEHHETVPNAVYGYVVGASIAKGRIASMDLTEAKAAPGVLAIVTAENAGKLDKGEFNTAKLLGGPEIEHYHQAVALVVAETFEQARAAAQLVKVEYTSAKGAFRSFGRERHRAQAGAGLRRRSRIPPSAISRALLRMRRSKSMRLTRTPDQSHAMMEPHASTARWDGDKLTLWTSNQMIAWGTGDMAKTLRIPKEKVHLISPFIGGGFGSKLFLRVGRVARGAWRACDRPSCEGRAAAAVYFQQHHASSGDDPAHPHRRRHATARSSRIGHESWSGDLKGGQWEPAVSQTRLLYAGANRMTASRLAVLDLPEGNAMRAPGRGAGHDGARNRHRRDGREARPRSHRVSYHQRYAGRSRESRRGLSPSATSPNVCALARKNSAGPSATRRRAKRAMGAGWSASALRRHFAITC